MDIQAILNTPLIKENESLQWVNGGVILALVLGGAGLYLMVPERKRKALFK